MAANHDIAKLDDLIVTTIDSVKGYEYSARHAAAGDHAALFVEMAAERRSVVAALQARSRALRGTPNDFGSAAGTLHRAFEGLRHALGGGDAAIVAEIERGEDYIKQEYDRALADKHVSADTCAVVRQCYQSVLLGHDRASRMKRVLERTG